VFPVRRLNAGFNRQRARGSTVGGNRAGTGAAHHVTKRPRHTRRGYKRRVGGEGSRTRTALRIISVISSFLGRSRAVGKQSDGWEAANFRSGIEGQKGPEEAHTRMK